MSGERRVGGGAGARRAADLVVVALAAAVLFLPWLGARDLWNPNEPTYGRAVVEMSERGDWMVPRVNDQVFAEKPILYFWLALAASRLCGGVSELALRLPSAAAGLASALLAYLLVRPYAGRRRALLSAGILATTYLVFWSARSIQMDLLVTAAILGAVLAATRALDHEAPPLASGASFGASLALGFLAKGPVGALLPLCIVGAAAPRRSVGLLERRFSLAALAVFTAVAAPWFVVLRARGETAFLHELLYRQNVERFLAPWDHAAPVWYYLGTFWTDMAPWSLFLPLALGLRPVDESERRLHRLAWVWLAVVVGLFSLSASKRSPYILPAAPAVAILVAALVEGWSNGRLGPLRRRATALVFAALAAGMLACALALAFGDRSYTHGATSLELLRSRLALGLSVAGLALAALLAAPRLRRIGAPVALFIFLAALYLFTAGAILPAVDPYKSHRAFCSEIRSLAADRPLRGYRLWKWRASYSFYSGRTVPSLDGPVELQSYWSEPAPVFLLVERGALAEARGVIGERAPLARAEVGDNAAYLFSNAPAQPEAPERAERSR